MRFHHLFLPAACALLPACAAAAGLALELRPAAQVAGARIILGDVAVIDARGENAARLARLDIGSAPRVGYVERLTRAQIARAVQRQSGVESIAWSGADSVTVRVQSHVVGADVIGTAAIEAVRREFGAAHPDLEVNLVSQPVALEVPGGAVQVRARQVNATALAARMSQWVDILVDGVVYRSALVHLSVAQQRKAYVARRALDQGALVGAADFTVADANVAGMDAVPVGPGMRPFRLRAPIKAGQLLATNAVLDGGKILRGDRVKLLVSSGQIGIETEGVAIAEAGPGQRLAVRPAGGTDIVTGRVSQAGTVIIE